MKILQNVTNGEYNYIMTSKRVSIENVKATVYGIGISGDSENELIDDISCDKDDVRELFRLIVEGGASPLHLRDITEDHIS